MSVEFNDFEKLERLENSELEQATVEDRFTTMKAMNFLVKSLNNEDAYFEYWIELVPDEATEEDLMYIALDDELYGESCGLFRKLINKYGRDGFYACGDKEAY